MNKLKEYLRFGHLFKYIYGFELKWERIRPLFEDITNTGNNLKVEIDNFLDNLNKE